MQNPHDEDLFELKGVKLPAGTQIVYVPLHIHLAHWDHNDKWQYPNGCQPGFVTSGPTAQDGYFCRYWRFDNDTELFIPELRTVANSELTPMNRLVVTDTFHQLHVVRELEYMEKTGQ